MRVNHSYKSDVQLLPCDFRSNGYDHPLSTMRVSKASTDGMCYTNDVLWTGPRAAAPALPASSAARAVRVCLPPRQDRCSAFTTYHHQCHPSHCHRRFSHRHSRSRHRRRYRRFK